MALFRVQRYQPVDRDHVWSEAEKADPISVLQPDGEAETVEADSHLHAARQICGDVVETVGLHWACVATDLSTGSEKRFKRVD